ncbi:MAG TPA: hypothetical protein VMP41_05470 [Acidimicrobiales bacterium]|nr:hypothetical protein [Acidimicrobiales bacterium]
MDHTEPDKKTKEDELAEAGTAHIADRGPTEDEERSAEESRQRYAGDADAVAEHERSMGEKGADEKGEGRIP